MCFFSWCSRRVGGLSIITLVVLCAVVIFNEHQISKNKVANPTWFRSFLTLTFAYYSLFVHLLVSGFPLRACWAIWNLSRGLKNASSGQKWYEFGAERKLSTYSLSSSETLTPSRVSATSRDTEDFDSGYFADVEPETAQHLHAILIPNYKEDVDVLRETLDVLASHPQARPQYDVYLAMEGREVNSDVKALSLMSEYLKKFHSIDFTMHPIDIPNDSPGKSSNISWAARKASELYASMIRDDVIVTPIATSHQATSKKSPSCTLNIRKQLLPPSTPLQLSSTEMPTSYLYLSASRIFSGVLVAFPGYIPAHGSALPLLSTLSLGLADKVGGWDGDCEAIGEDLHMYIKCFFALNGNLTRRTVMSPASQTNVSSDLKGARGIAGGVQARYKQGLRHMWGSLDSGYALRRLVSVWKDRKCRVRTFKQLHSGGSHNLEYIPDDDLENLMKNQATGNGAFSDVCYHRVDSPDWARIFFLLHRLLEAHFFPTHMMVLIIASSVFTVLFKGHLDPLQIAWTFNISGYLRILGFALVALYFALYENFHIICVNTRKAEMKAAGLYEGMQDAFSYRTFWGNILDYFMVPIAAPVFGSIPAIQAQMSHFYTLDLVYTVSRKPSNKRDSPV